MSGVDDKSSTQQSSDDSDSPDKEQSSTVQADYPEAQKTSKGDGGSARATTPVSTADGDGQPEDAVAGYEAELKAIQAKLDAAKKEKAVAATRKTQLDATANQRATTLLVIDDADEAATNWDAEIATKVQAREQADLTSAINAADQQVDDAEDAFDAKTQAVADAEATVKTRADELASIQKAYADKQKELSDLAATIKASQAEIEKLRAAVKAAIDSGQWTLAFYKNNRLCAEIGRAKDLTAPSREEGIVGELKRFEGSSGTIAEAQKASDDAKKKLDEEKDALKAAEQEMKAKKADRDTAISIFL